MPHLLDETGEGVAPENHDQPEYMVTSGRYLLGPDREWLSLSPASRATFLGLQTTGKSILVQLPSLEATMRAELLKDRVVTTAMQRGASTILDLLFITFQTYLPSEPSARVDGLTTIEAPLRTAKNFQEALSTLRNWRQQVLTVVTDLGGNPEPLKLLSSLKI